jgi:serine/threonine protein phosphatase PrpC/CRP-like cAMP-binding protein
MKLSDSIRFYAATDVGKVREHNEDNFLVDKKLALFIVADGMGGHAAGEVASAIAVRTVHEEVKREKEMLDDYAAGSTGTIKVTPRDIVALIEHAVQRACSKIHEEAAADTAKRGMGTTLSALLVVGNQGFIAHVGDSRIYLMRDGHVQQVTEDHTVYNELIKRGKLSKEQIEKIQQKNAITRAVGVYERVDVDTLVIELISGDTLMLASDGLHGYLTAPEELSEPLGLAGDESVKALVRLANDRGGKDNITSVVIRIGEEGAVDAARAKRLALKRDVLSRMPIFSRLSERELLRVMQVVEVRLYKDGDVVIREGDKGDELFIVLDGKVRIARGDQVITHLGPGEHVGEMALIRSVPRSATVSAVGEAELVSIRRQDFFEILRKEHEVAVKMLWQFLGVLADRLDQTNNQLHEAKRELAAEDITDDIFAVDVEAVAPGPPSISRS